MSEQEFQRWQAYDKVEPLNHEAKMLGLIAYMLANYIGMKIPEGMSLVKMCMPWTDPDRELDGSDFKGVLPGL